MKIETLIERLKEARSPVSLSEFIRVAKHFGYSHDDTRASRDVFRNWSGRRYVVPVHSRKIKAVYMRNFIKEQE